MSKRKSPRVGGIFDWLRRSATVAPPPAPSGGFDPRVDYYAALEVASTATIDEIRRAYRRIAARYHPDVDPRPEARRMFDHVTAAYNVLSDDERRAAYDAARTAVPAAERMPPRRPPSPMGPPTGLIPVLEEEKEEKEEAKAPSPPGRPPIARRPLRTPWERIFGPFETLSERREARAVAVPPVRRAGPPAVRALPSVTEMAAYIRGAWPLREIIGFARERRASPEFQASRTSPIDRLAGIDPAVGVERELAPWLGIPPQFVEAHLRAGTREALWRDVFVPMFSVVEGALQALKPADLPGTFRILADPSGVDLHYGEAGARLW